MKRENKEMKENETNKNNETWTKMNRRTFVKLTGATIGAMTIGTGISGLIKPASAAPLTKFTDALIIPPVAVPGVNASYPGADYYELSIQQFESHKFHSSFPNPTKTYGIGGVAYLGPTIVATKNKKVVVKFTNNLPLGPHLMSSAIDTTVMGSSPIDPVPDAQYPPATPPDPWIDENRIAIHLHGGKTAPEHDGHPRRWFSPVGSTQANPYPENPGIGSYIYEFSNEQPPAFLWYHDHAWGITRFNPFCGIAAAYLLRDQPENDLLNGTNIYGYNRNLQKIPTGEFDIPIVLQDKFLGADGAMLYPNIGDTLYHPKWVPEYFGDSSIVNGVYFPYVNVQKRRYRLHILNGANARFFNLYFNNNVPFYIIGSDQGFLPQPFMRRNILISPGERFDAIVDFTNVPSGTMMTLQNDAQAPYPSGEPSNALPEIMQFKVIPRVGQDTTTPPMYLRLPPIAAINAPPKPWKEIVLRENADEFGNPYEVLLDGKHFPDSLDNPLITERPGQIDVWQFVNLTVDAHPMHLHLVGFKILNRQSFNADAMKPVWDAWVAGGRVGPRPSVDAYLTGNVRAPAPEELGWKDTAKAYPGEVLRIISKFDLPSGTTSGRYVSHCHILEHEENDMMFNFEVK